MNNSVEVIRDQDGYFRHPNGRPLVVIFDSKEDKTPHEISWQEPIVASYAHEPKEDTTSLAQSKRGKTAKADSQPVKFVNVTHPARFNRKTKRNIRTPVNRDPQRRKHGEQNSIEGSTETGFATGNRTKYLPLQLTPTLRQPFLSLDSVPTFPIKMEPYMYSLVEQYIAMTTKVHISPGKVSGYLQLGLSDAALFHALLCGTVITQDLLLKRRESPAKSKHMKEACRLVSTRLQGSHSELSDGTFLAVAHLADFENITGNFANWILHMNGLQKMVEIKGGLATLNDDVKNKIYRANLFGCSSTLSQPRFSRLDTKDLYPRPSSPIQPNPALSPDLRDIITKFDMKEDLIGILGELQNLTSLLNSTTMHLTRMTLLSPIHHQLFSHQPSGSQDQNAVIDELCCIGTRFYLKTIYDHHLRLQFGWVPANVMTTSALISRLKFCLDMTDLTMATEQVRALFLWVLFMGGAALAGTKDRAWFVARLAKASATLTMMEMQLCSWEDAKSWPVRFFWVDRIHEDFCRDLWDDALVIAGVLFGNDC